LHLLGEQFADLVHKEAVASFDKDQGFRLWGTKHGVVGFGARQVRGRIDECDRADEQIEVQRAPFESLLNIAPDAFI
jgi:hypothetical protein